MPEKFLIKGKVPLKGKVKISGYKNSALAILPATLLTKEESIIENLPLCSDVLNQIEMIKKIGAKVEWIGKKKIRISPKELDPEKLPFEIFEKIRGSVLLIPPLISRFGEIKIPHPGGDKIGLRPITVHLEALKNFGIEVKEMGRFYYLKKKKGVVSQKIVLKEFSVTATENIMMLSALLNRKIKIEIAAAEPQVQDLGNFLKKMGVKIKGLGTHTIEIEGQKKLKGARHKIIPDWSEAGTFLLAFAITGGKGEVLDLEPEHLTLFLEKLKEIGVKFKVSKNKISVFASKNFKATKIQVLPYPGFQTDLQPQISVLLTQAEGKSLIHDPLYENRFLHLHELRKMGADVEITDPHRALIFGKKGLIGNKLSASDIRAGAALVLAGLIAKGETIVENIEQIERGFENFDEKLKRIGAKIERVS